MDAVVFEAEEMPQSLLAPSMNGRPKKDALGTVMPCGPLVKANQFTSTRRIISPKASVTMAR